MAHDLIIILDRVKSLQGANVTGAGVLEDLRGNAVGLDTWLGAVGEETDPEQIEAVHDWLEAVQGALVTADEALKDKAADCPNVS